MKYDIKRSGLLISILFILWAPLAAAIELCTGDSNDQECVGPYQLSWKGHSAYDASSTHYHLIALATIADAFTSEPTGYRVPTIKELITIMGFDGQTFPTVDSWLIGDGYFISSTYGSSVAGIHKIMAIDISTKEIVPLEMSATGDSYYLIATHRAGEIINN